MSLHLVSDAGERTVLALGRWSDHATEAEIDLLGALPPPVLDLGCGPGRLVAALSARGTAVLGVDASPAAVDLTRATGGTALCRSVFDPLPGEGRWRSVLLVDGNVGIGGDPIRLLGRVAALLAPGGVAIVEAEERIVTRIGSARLHTDGAPGPWFPWAWVAARDLPGLAREAGLELDRWERPEGRWMARLRPSRP